MQTHVEPRHLTFAGRIGSLARSPSWLAKNLWILAVLALPLLGLFGYFVRGAVEGAVRDNARDQVTAILNADVEALRIWMEIQEATALALSKERRIASLTGQLIALAHDASVSKAQLLESPLSEQLRDELMARIQSRGYQGYVVVDSQTRIVASSSAELVGAERMVPQEYLERLKAGQGVVTRPVPSKVLLDDVDGEQRAGVPTMFAIAPLRDADGQLVGALGLRIPPERDFTRILSVGRFGETGETYAFDRAGVVISRSRFEDDLKRLGIIADQPHVTSILNLELRNPGVDLTQGSHPAASRRELPLTKMAQAAVAAEPGVVGYDVDGYRGYRGVPVIGAWIWIADYNFGVATEIDAAEAYRPASVLRTAQWAMFAALALLSGAVIGVALMLGRAARRAREAVAAAKVIGQYKLCDKLGQGGMGVVYRAQHAMLQRPTAVKMLDPVRTTDESVSRFEREVRLTSQLNHPNTITIYDFGRTDEGVFYYAMELLTGIDLEQLVAKYGPQPPARVVHLLRQVCGSLAEAHGTGLIHRDIKPGNIMLTQRGGMSDFIKVLDFGLVKALSAEKEAAITVANTLTGTPLYMAPESIEHAEQTDARSDLYAVGAVGYFLLTGTTVFSGATAVEVCMQHLSKTPESPSQRLGRPIPAELEDAILRCLAKKPEARPQSAKELAALLATVPADDSWTDADAERWWSGFNPPSLLETRDAGTQRVALETQVVR